MKSSSDGSASLDGVVAGLAVDEHQQLRGETNIATREYERVYGEGSRYWRIIALPFKAGSSPGMRTVFRGYHRPTSNKSIIIASWKPHLARRRVSTRRIVYGFLQDHSRRRLMCEIKSYSSLVAPLIAPFVPVPGSGPTFLYPHCSLLKTNGR